MTSTAIYDLLSRHLDAWYADTGAEGPTLRIHMHNAIQEALAEQDKLWQAGNETLRHERNYLRELRDGDNKLILALAEGAAIPITASDKCLGAQWEQFQDGVLLLRHERDMAQNKLAAVAAGLSFDPAVDRDLETCARRVYHERDDYRKRLDGVVQRHTT